MLTNSVNIEGKKRKKEGREVRVYLFGTDIRFGTSIESLPTQRELSREFGQRNNKIRVMFLNDHQIMCNNLEDKIEIIIGAFEVHP